MRGCLFVVALAAIVLGIGAWFGSPVLASTVISAALQNAGYHATTSTVTATADPPPKLLLGRADRVEIIGTDVAFRTFHAARLDLVLADVDVVARTAGRISGRISGAEMTTTGGDTATADVVVDGAASAAAASIVVDPATVDRVVKGAFLEKLGTKVSSTSLVAPDTLRVTTADATLEGRLVIDSTGALALSTPLGVSTILSVDRTFPLRLQAVHVVDGSLRIDATLDAEALLGG